MTKTIKLGILGCEHGVDGHGVVMQNVRGMELVYLCDKKRRALNEGRSKIETPLSVTTNMEKMMSAVDAVIISTPDQFHIEHFRMALEHNLHVLLENPVAITEDGMEDFQKLLGVAESKNLVVTSCHPRRFDTPPLWLKKNLSRYVKKLGSITGFHYEFTYHKPGSGWKQILRSLLLDHHGHEIDLVNFLFGKASFNEVMHDDSPDRYLVTGARSDGINFSFHGTRFMEQKVYPEWMIVRFENGSVTVDAKSGTATIRNTSTRRISKRECGSIDYATRSLGVTQNFADAILGKAPNYLTNEDMILNNLSGIKLLKKGTFSYEG